ncbi:MAG: RNA polymerase factor sigma-54 [Phenylobacterium sp.]|uniref:RNA polymerase factor sigma-54 n=1 Tax=Phenylobacterium sp. TaxID=1871053 RepID=UPI0025CF3582|nr:RNA polymerase factor sigma-54 [Phenylobacterium sp.]MCA3712774.1 RNA polymerase factor sigma-54 [Phenylobacterium sp.]MCA3724942.1 RNA polymerase factor sigma-54 [Phenylobacterium sp.]MCA3730300.1 RNA polymerase factor sigma-54 [Phenylobacterium sp.]MCA3746736.1 RNA polymerase factor sigma-54 [Phenylobacterium sp.]MCA6228843.1 RNA polymerase factor sigma-54 [Phenylobacterium sp.]
MALGARLEVRQGQGLVITPQLQQAIKLLQLTHVELEAYVETELERNPLLVREDVDPEVDAADPDPRNEEVFAADRIPESGAGPDLDISLEAEASPGERATGDLSLGEEAGGAVDWSRVGSGGSGFEGDEDLSQRLPEARTLREHLAEQLAMAGLEGARQAAALVLIDSVDESGYLRCDMEETAERLACDPPFLDSVLGVLQGFEPTGVFARDLRECLYLQLKERNRCDPAMIALLDHLDLLARRDLAALRRVCGVDDEDLRDMISEIRALTPRPGIAFGGEPLSPVTPDVIVREGSGGLWNIELNSDTLPRLLVDRRYFARVSAGARTEAEKIFVADCYSQANWLVRCLDQRARTILKVASEVVRQQDGFLAFGVSHLRPLNLRTIADAIGMHESTVSRVTSNKYISTPRGVFELKFFFTAAIAATHGGEAHSAESVRHRIRQLIEAERPGHDVHSDDRIVEILKDSGVDIARRTVAKYREAMRIPSSTERRRLMAVAG